MHWVILILILFCLISGFLREAVGAAVDHWGISLGLLGAAVAAFIAKGFSTSTEQRKRREEHEQEMARRRQEHEEEMARRKEEVVRENAERLERMALSCPRCGTIARAVHGTGSIYGCAKCGQRFVGPVHNVDPL